MTELLAKYFSGNISEAEIKKVHEWRNDNDENAEAFLEYATIWHYHNPDSGVPSKDQEVLKSILNSSEADHPSGAFKSPFRNIIKYAAILLIGIFGSIGMYNQLTDTEAMKIVTAPGQTKEIVLNDGSTVVLDENSEISFEKELSGKSREIFLSGKAFFEVERNVNRPFIVRTEKSVVEVLGTSFLVEEINSKQLTEVTVQSGKVKVELRGSVLNEANIVELFPGDRAQISTKDESVVKERNDDSNYLTWKTKVMKFNADNLRYVLDILEETYHIRIDSDKIDIDNCKLTATYDNQPIESIMEIIGETFGVEVVKSGANTFSLIGVGC